MSSLKDATKGEGGSVEIWFTHEDGRWQYNSASQEYQGTQPVAGMLPTIGDGYEPSPAELRAFAAALVAEAERAEAELAKVGA